MMGFIWFCIGGMVGIFVAGMLSSGKMADERATWNRYVSELLFNWTGTTEEMCKWWDREYLGR